MSDERDTPTSPPASNNETTTPSGTDGRGNGGNDGVSRGTGRRGAFVAFVVALFATLVASSAFWSTDMSIGGMVLLALVSAPVAALCFWGAFKYSERDRLRIGWIGVVVGTAAVLGLVAFAVGLAGDRELLTVPSWLADHFGTAWIIIPVIAWLVSSVIARMVLRNKTGEVKKSVNENKGWILKTFNDNRIVGGIVVFVYLSLVGMLFEASFFVRLGLPAFRYTDPHDFAFAILNHPVLVTIVATVVLILSTIAYLAANVVVKVYREGDRANADHEKTSTGETDGKTDEGMTDEGKTISGGGRVGAIGLWFLGLPGPAVILFLIVVLTVVFFLTLPLMAAVNAAGITYDSIENEQSGRLRLVRPAIYADGAKHIASTAKHMVATLARCPDENWEVTIHKHATSGERGTSGTLGDVSQSPPVVYETDGKIDVLIRWRNNDTDPGVDEIEFAAGERETGFADADDFVGMNSAKAEKVDSHNWKFTFEPKADDSQTSLVTTFLIEFGAAFGLRFEEHSSGWLRSLLPDYGSFESYERIRFRSEPNEGVPAIPDVVLSPDWNSANTFHAIVGGSTHSGVWKPVVLPWSSVASFDMADENKESCFRSWVQDKTEEDDPPEPGASVSIQYSVDGVEFTQENWQAQAAFGSIKYIRFRVGNEGPYDPPIRIVGPPGPSGAAGSAGKSVEIQYSRTEGTDDWRPSWEPGDRYIRFNGGRAIRFVGEKGDPGKNAVAYSVRFDPFSLQAAVSKQLDFEKLPEFPSSCHFSVVGCATKSEPFVWLCTNSKNPERCILPDDEKSCRWEKSTGQGIPCFPRIKKTKAPSALGEDKFGDAGTIMRAVVENCTNGQRRDLYDCAEDVNQILNCGVANLRGMAVYNRLVKNAGEDSLALPLESNGDGDVDIAKHLAKMCIEPVEVRKGKISLVRAAESELGSYLCWDQRTSLNRAAVIGVGWGRQEGDCLMSAGRVSATGVNPR